MELNEKVVEIIAEEATTDVAEPLKDDIKASSSRRQKIASVGMGFLLQQMRATTSTPSTSAPVKKTSPQELDSVSREIRRTPIRPIAAEYSLLNEENRGIVELHPIQIVRDCYNKSTTPSFNFADECDENNYVRSCKFAPTGNHLITDSEDRYVRIFRVEDDRVHLDRSILNGDLIYDLAWDLFGEHFATTSSGSPIKLWDTNGQQVAVYRGINHMDTLDFAYSMAFDLSGEKLYAGYRGVVRRFDINRPGDQASELKTSVKGQAGQKSVLSCVEMSPAMIGVFAIGSFNSYVGLYSDFTNSCDMLIPTQNKYITCLKYSSDGHRLFVGSRKSSFIECYDVRNCAKILSRYSRPVTTGQRVYFKLDPDDRYMFSGSSKGDIRVFDLKGTQTSGDSVVEPMWIIPKVSECTTAGFDLHPSKPLVSTTHGQRVFPMPLIDDTDIIELGTQDENDYLSHTRCFDNSLKLWRL